MQTLTSNPIDIVNSYPKIDNCPRSGYIGYGICVLEVIMPNYEKMYFTLFNAISDALQLLEEKDVGRAAFILAKAQYNAEEEYISAE